MKKVFVFLALALIAALGFTANNTTTVLTAPKEGDIRVWVEFQPDKKVAVEAALKGNGAQFHYTFDNLHSFVVTLPAVAIDGISHNPNVVSIEEDVPRYLEAQETPYGIDLVQARDVWDADRDGIVDTGAPSGAGVIVCVIDSGLKATHEEFVDVNIIGGYPSDWNNDTCGHGTHVAGTIVASNNNVGVVGVTPGGASLYIVKVFDGPDCGWAYSSTLADAANRCADAGANIISMSLGGPSSNRKEQRTFDTLYSQGILSIAAAGNDGNTAYNYPASYDSVMSVAAIDEGMNIADFSQQNDQVEISAPGVGVLSTVPWVAEAYMTVDGGTYEANHIEYAPYTIASGDLVDGGLCDRMGAWNGKVVLCSRGDISFYDKVMNAQNSGAAAAVIYNNEPGNFLGTLGDSASASDILALSISQEDGQYLVANKLGIPANLVSDFDPNSDGYEAWDGTSMATPHISGLAALIWSADASKTNVEIRDAINTTALELGVSGRDSIFGFGLAQAYAAWQYLVSGNVPTPTPDPTTTPDPTPTPDPTITPDPTGTMSVSAVEMSSSPAGRNNYIYTKVTVIADGQPVIGATVSIAIELPEGGYATGTAETESDGTVTFSLKTKLTGEFISTVTEVSHNALIWDGVPAGGSIIIP